MRAPLCITVKTYINLPTNGPTLIGLFGEVICLGSLNIKNNGIVWESVRDPNKATNTEERSICGGRQLGKFIESLIE